MNCLLHFVSCLFNNVWWMNSFYTRNIIVKHRWIHTYIFMLLCWQWSKSEPSSRWRSFLRENISDESNCLDQFMWNLTWRPHSDTRSGSVRIFGFRPLALFRYLICLGRVWIGYFSPRSNHNHWEKRNQVVL